MKYRIPLYGLTPSGSGISGIFYYITYSVSLSDNTEPAQSLKTLINGSYKKAEVITQSKKRIEVFVRGITGTNYNVNLYSLVDIRNESLVYLEIDKTSPVDLSNTIQNRTELLSKIKNGSGIITSANEILLQNSSSIPTFYNLFYIANTVLENATSKNAGTYTYNLPNGFIGLLVSLMGSSSRASDLTISFQYSTNNGTTWTTANTFSTPMASTYMTSVFLGKDLLALFLPYPLNIFNVKSQVLWRAQITLGQNASSVYTVMALYFPNYDTRINLYDL